MNAVRRAMRAVFPPPRIAPDGRAEWPSRAPYVLASMGGTIGFGNLLRFPSQVFNDNGIQWFIPYLMTICLLAIPVLILEVAIGQAYHVSGELIGLCLFSWFIVWICLYKGIAITARVVYITIVLLIILTIVLVGRGASLPNAGRGIKLYFGEFNADELAAGKIGQAATSQVFYSTGVGFGCYTAHASYNSKFANAVEYVMMICSANALFESFAAFAVFGVVGNLGMTPESQQEAVGTYTLGFYTLPSAI
ncbi:Transporter [Pyrenophora tritici-repentis]|uniref:Uncharacterized protein n=2 Tax=Pyrenophora tritici-repentis TaxID=45151 RepID=A0A2W1CND1_9PLEO|nr:Transporter [Pyrenophora tritici-repentis]KAF7571723.1 hypothetical protein PtrM4_092230 [Pyrenophora tritici-repentis]KAI0604747.1 Transporter [Pyrenophora tritici-repentis]KAI1670101.1 Transporter [Pyrenophora tritici-repentis]PZC89398.1 Na+-dependent transporterSNF family [Pyrenophora tritici-repentis]